MKTYIKLILQRLLGFERYLYLFSLFIIRKLRWDKNEGDFLHFLDLLPEKGVVLDIGANLGVMSYYLASTSERRMVFAFEPISYNYRNLKRIKKKYKLDNLRTYQIALGDEEGEIEMVLPVRNSVRFHGLAHVKHESINELNSGEVFKCPVKRLDSFHSIFAEHGRVTGIKIDVENFEYFVLKGGGVLIKEHAPIIYSELWDNENRSKTMAFLQDLGYKTMVHQSSGLEAFDPQIHTTQNFFFVPVAQ